MALFAAASSAAASASEIRPALNCAMPPGGAASLLQGAPRRTSALLATLQELVNFAYGSRSARIDAGIGSLRTRS